MTEELPEPKNRKEEFLANIAGMDVELPEPANREEIYLNAIAENGGGGGGGDYTAGDGIDITNNTISVDTSTIQEKLTAGSNVAISAENVISATDTTYSAFTGTDGTAAGTSGLVPAPATTDAGKFLKADGTWDTAGGASFEPTILTKADYNYPTNNPTSLALWLLPTGYYRVGEDGMFVWVHNSMAVGGMYSGGSFYIDASPSLHTHIVVFDDYTGNMNSVGYSCLVQKTTGDAYKKTSSYSDSLVLSCYDALNLNAVNVPLSAKQGKVLNDKIEGRVITGAGAPTTSTVGTVGKLYEDTTNGKLYQCTAVSGNTYTWTEIGAGGGGGSTMIELTAADMNANSNDWSDTDPTNFNCIALWKLPYGVYYINNSALPSADRIPVYCHQYMDVFDTTNSFGLYVTAPYPGQNGDVMMFCFGSPGSSNASYGAYMIRFYRAQISTGLQRGDTFSVATYQQLKEEFFTGEIDATPTSSTWGIVGRLYRYNNNGTYELWICLDDSNSTYTWKQITMV